MYIQPFFSLYFSVTELRITLKGRWLGGDILAMQMEYVMSGFDYLYKLIVYIHRASLKLFCLGCRYD